MSLAVSTSRIVQTAFRFLEMRLPSSLDDESEEAIAAQEQYDRALGLCLEAGDWSFASELLILPQIIAGAVPVDPRLPYASRLPPDALALREVVTQRTASGASSINWRIDRDVLRADAAGPLLVRCTKRVTDEAALPATFQTAVALQLAILLAGTYLQVASKRAALEGQLQEAMTRAARTDARSASSASWSQSGATDDWSAGAVR